MEACETCPANSIVCRRAGSRGRNGVRSRAVKRSWSAQIHPRPRPHPLRPSRPRRRGPPCRAGQLADRGGAGDVGLSAGGDPRECGAGRCGDAAGGGGRGGAGGGAGGCADQCGVCRAGAGAGDAARGLVAGVLGRGGEVGKPRPTVLDADALTILSRDPALFAAAARRLRPDPPCRRVRAPVPRHRGEAGGTRHQGPRLFQGRCDARGGGAGGVRGAVTRARTP